MIFIIDDDREMAECLAISCRPEKVRIFSNAIEAVSALDEELPGLIFLDILLDGPDGFTFLNEIASYKDTAKIPVVVVSSLEIEVDSLGDYGVIGVLNKATMTPRDIKGFLEKAEGMGKSLTGGVSESFTEGGFNEQGD